jgi:hypothetical protein
MTGNAPHTSPAFDNGSVATAPRFDALMAFNRPALEAMTEINSRMLEQIAAVNNAWAHFVQRRIQRDFGLPRTLAACQSPQDYFRVYAEFVQTAAQDWQQEFAEIARMNQAFGNEAADLVRSKAEAASARLNG